MNEYKLVCDSSFDYRCAEWSDTYRLCYLRKTIFGRDKWETEVAGYYPMEGRVKAKGDLRWAKKIAKELGIEVPKPNREHK